MNGLIRASLGNPYAVTVMSLTLIVLGSLSIFLIPIDILPVFRSPAVQTLTFYNGMSATSIAHDITNRMERWTGQANGMAQAGVAVDPWGQHRPQLLPGRCGPQRRLDPGELAGPGGHSQPSARHPSSGGAAVRPDIDHSRVRGGRGQRRPGEQRVGALRRWPL